jgi:hypothetical protein
MNIDKIIGRTDELKRPEMNLKAVIGVTVKHGLMENEQLVLIAPSTIVNVRYIAVLRK